MIDTCIMYEIYLKKFMHIKAWNKDEKKTFGHSQKRESEEDFNACMNIDGWIHTLCYEIYLKNIMHKMWKLEMKLKKTHLVILKRKRAKKTLMHAYRWMDTYIMSWNIFEKLYAWNVNAWNKDKKKTQFDHMENERERKKEI